MECTRAKLSSRSVINDSAGSAGRTMAEDLENPEDKVRDNTISVRRSKQFMRTVTAPARSSRRTRHRLHSHRLGGGCAASRAPATHGRRCTHPNPTALPYRASWSLLVPRARLRSDPTQPRSTLFLARFFLSRRHTHPNPTALPCRAPHGAARATTQPRSTLFFLYTLFPF